jgi:hypothetical protein
VGNRVSQDFGGKMDFARMTHSALLRFAVAVDAVMEANDLSPEERRDLIGHWAYRCQEPDMPEQLQAAIQRCQGDPDDPRLQITATCRISCITGEQVAFNPC